MVRLSGLIQQQLGGKLSLSRLAQEVGLSPQHFARLFKATYGTTPHQYVQTLRIEAAVEALRGDPTVPSAHVALTCGFASHSHMTELMRRRLGVRPSALRRDPMVMPQRPARRSGGAHEGTPPIAEHDLDKRVPILKETAADPQ